jgi:hypothetical protein
MNDIWKADVECLMQGTEPSRGQILSIIENPESSIDHE